MKLAGPAALAVCIVMCGCGGSSPSAPGTATCFPGGGNGLPPCSPNGLPSTPLGWTFAEDGGVRVASGFVEGVVQVNGAVFLFVGPGPTVYRSTDGLNFAQVSSNVPQLSDNTFMTLPNGTVRMFYQKATPSGSAPGDELSAVSSDGINWTVEAGTRFSIPGGISQARVIALPGGGCRLYSGVGVASLSSTGAPHLASSSDCLTFADEGPISSLSGTADQFPIALGSGFLMLAGGGYPAGAPPNSTFAAMWLYGSSDGRTWSVDTQPVWRPTTFGITDPAALPLGGDSYRIYAETNDSRSTNVTNPRIISGVLRRGAPGPTFTQPAGLPPIIPHAPSGATPGALPKFVPAPRTPVRIR